MSSLAIVSGYFNPLHVGHLDMMEGASNLADELLVVVNNDQQQLIKKGKIIMPESDRLRIVSALKIVDLAMISIDEDPTITKTLGMIANQYIDKDLIFANGGDRDSSKAVPEAEICTLYGIRMVFDAGGTVKADSSSRINDALNVKS